MKFVNTSDLPWEGVSHDPEIKKRVFLKPNEVPQVMTFGEAVFKPGQSVDTHKHDTMYEVFYILEGKAEFVVKGKKYVVEPGSCFMIAEGEEHSQSNPFDRDVRWVYFGVATD